MSKNFKVNFKSATELLNPQELGEYHLAWIDVDKTQRIDRRSVHCGRDSQVVIGNIFQFNDYPIYRVPVFQKDLRKVNPYQYGEEKQYIHTFWHEAHIWQVFEQMVHSSRDYAFKKRGEENREMVYTQKLAKEFVSPVLFSKEVSAEIIWEEAKRNFDKDGVSFRPEEFFFSVYNEENNIIGKMYLKGLSRKRDWKILWDRISDGDESARENMIQKIRCQSMYLDKIKRSVPYSGSELIEMVKKNQMKWATFENFFSLF